MAQVQGEEIYLSHSGQEVDDNIDEVQAARGSEASLSARLAADQQRQETEIGAVAALGAKNLLENTVAVGTQTIRTVEVTVNADGSVDVGAGTITGGNLDLHVNTNAGAGMITGEKYILSGCPQGGSASTYRLNCTGVGYDAGEGKEFTYGGGALDVYLRVYSGQTISSPLHFAPMIRRAEITDDTFAPYAPTNRELYDGKAGKGTFDLTIAGSPLVASEYSYSCIVTGDIVTICIRLVLGDELAVNTSRNLFKIPADYRPPVTCAGTGYANSKLCTFWVNTSGDIKIRIDEAIPSGSSINANFCYSYKAANWQTITPASLQSAPASLMQAGRIDAELTDAQEVTENDT